MDETDIDGREAVYWAMNGRLPPILFRVGGKHTRVRLETTADMVGRTGDLGVRPSHN